MDAILAQADSGAMTTSEAMEKRLYAQIGLRNNHRLPDGALASPVNAGEADG